MSSTFQCICKELRSITTRFWWDGDEERRTLYWWNWGRCVEKRNEDVWGFHDLVAFNLPLVGKQVCLLITYPNTLVHGC